MTRGTDEARLALCGIVERMGLGARPEVRAGEDGGVVLELLGDGADSLADGEVLDALQHLVNRMARQAAGDDADDPGLPVAVDAGGWRDRRSRELGELARSLAQDARNEGRAVTAPPLSAYERRLVHLALEGEEGITTRSVGEGNRRRLRVFPKEPGAAGTPA